MKSTKNSVPHCLFLQMRKLSMDELSRKTITEFKQANKNKIVVVLDNIRSMHNVGSIFRTADAFLIEAIILCGYTPQPPHRDIQKTALGATETVDWLYFPSTLEAVRSLRQKEYAVFAVEQTVTSIPLQEFGNTSRRQTALIFGNEVDGVGTEALVEADGSIQIPQWGMKHSLNVSVAAAIVLWEMVRAAK